VATKRPNLGQTTSAHEHLFHETLCRQKRKDARLKRKGQQIHEKQL
jgi:hypothetical protein